MKKVYDQLVSSESINTAEKALKVNGFLPETVATAVEALARIKELIPKGSSVMNGSSRTLEEIGFIDYFSGGGHGWDKLHHSLLSEKHSPKQAEVGKEFVIFHFY